MILYPVSRELSSKPIPQELKKKTVGIVVSPFIIGLLENDVKLGKADTLNMMIVKILKDHYSKQLNES